MKKFIVTTIFFFLLILQSDQMDPNEGYAIAARGQLEIIENLIKDTTISFSRRLREPKVIAPNVLGRHVLQFLASIRHTQKKMATILKFLRNTQQLKIANEAYMGIQEDVSKLAVETQRTLLYKSGSKRSCVACVMIEDAQVLTTSILEHVKQLLQGAMEAEKRNYEGPEDVLKNATMALKIAIETANDYGRVAEEFLGVLH